MLTCYVNSEVGATWLRRSRVQSPDLGLPQTIAIENPKIRIGERNESPSKINRDTMQTDDSDKNYASCGKRVLIHSRRLLALALAAHELTSRFTQYLIS